MTLTHRRLLLNILAIVFIVIVLLGSIGKYGKREILGLNGGNLL